MIAWWLIEPSAPRDVRHALRPGRRVAACLFGSAAWDDAGDGGGGVGAPALLPAPSRLVIAVLSEVFAATQAAAVERTAAERAVRDAAGA